MNINFRKKIFFLLLVAFLTFYGYLSYAVAGDFFRDADYNLMMSVQKNIPRVFDKALSLFTIFGSSEVTFFLLTILTILLYRKYRSFFLSGLSFFLIFAIELFGKIVIFHPSPPAIFNRYALDIYLPSSFVVHTASSYPSGHMSRAAYIIFLYCFFILISCRRFKEKILTLTISVLLLSGMFVSRIYLGEHWFSDVLGGTVLGIAAGILSVLLI